ncbi:molybdenum cofactor sulfurase [Chloropicon primus]|nr:molybdenum cofactor sulfurase [Chloropicon primus]
MSVHSVHIYPIKSCGGISARQALVERNGFRFDRKWMVVDEEKNRMVTQRKCPELARVRTALPVEALTISDPTAVRGALTVSVDDRTLEVPLEERVGGLARRKATVWSFTAEGCLDEGDEAADFFTKLVKFPCRLVRFNEDCTRRTEEGFAPRGQTAFSDGFPFLVATRESLDAVNDQLELQGDEKVPMDRFRANVVLQGLGEPFVEDRIKQIQIESAEPTIFDLVKPCSRCTVTTVDQEAGQGTGRQPLQALTTIHSGKKAEYGRKEWDRVPFFGWNGVVDPSMIGRVVSVDSAARVMSTRDEK